MKRVDVDDLRYEDNMVWDPDGTFFTGVSVETAADGSVLSEQPYQDGVKHGVYREYDARGKLVAEVPYRRGVGHGVGRWWHEGAERLAVEKAMKYGVLLSRKEWDAVGQLIDEWHIREDDPQYQRVLRLERDDRGDSDG
jgi:antitoxin component YwqK of YwqJK toxin-antitoxin module